MRARRTEISVQVLVFKDCTPIVPIGLVDLLRKAVDLAQELKHVRLDRKLELALVAVGRSRTLRAAGGVRLHCDVTLDGVRPGDVVLVPALDPDIRERLQANAAVLPWLRRAFSCGSDVMSVCTGAFVLAEAGLLDGRTATTHWAFQSEFAERYPNVRLASQAIVVDQGRIVTAGGATSFINLTHYLVERLLGHQVARAASRVFLIDSNKAPQGAYAALSSQRRHADGAILRAQDLIERDPARVPAVDSIASAVALSRRTFARRFREATGSTPRQYIQRVRVEAAKRALDDGMSVAAASERVGYADPVAFRKTFVQLAGLTPADYRARYGPRTAPAWVGLGRMPTRER